jgi:5-oxoprolinase (ATP-hydrolysing)
MTECPADGDYLELFRANYKREYGFTLSRDVHIDDIRIRAIGESPTIKSLTIPNSSKPPTSVKTTSVYFDEGGRQDVPIYLLTDLGAGDKIDGPALIIDNTTTTVVVPHCVAEITTGGNIRIDIGYPQERKKVGTDLDPIQLSVFAHRFMSIAEQMGRSLERTAVSTNIKERRDFSCALFAVRS